MKNLLELTTILSMIVALGALCWAAMGAIALDGDTMDAAIKAERQAGANRALIIALAAFATYIVARFLRKRMA